MNDYTIGIDLGGTKIAGAILDVHKGTLVARKVIPTQAHEGPDSVLSRIATLVFALIDEFGAGKSIGALGIGVPAVIDVDNGLTLLMPNLPGDWAGKQIVKILARKLDRPVWLINDARAFTLAEATWGAGRGAQTVVCFTIGTGIGGGIALNGQLHLGLDASAGELGHQTIDPHGPPCGCGNNGCLESMASGPAITALGIKAVLQGATTEIGKLVGQDITRITPETIMQAATLGDLVAREILERVGGYLGIGIANLVTILSPERVVIGGGVAALGDWLLNPAREVVKKRCRTAPITRIEIVRAALGDDAGVIGAALWAGQHENRRL